MVCLKIRQFCLHFRYEAVLADPQENDHYRSLAEFVVGIHDVLQSFGFLDLDPAGVQQLQGRINNSLREVEISY